MDSRDWLLIKDKYQSETLQYTCLTPLFSNVKMSSSPTNTHLLWDSELKERQMKCLTTADYGLMYGPICCRSIWLGGYIKNLILSANFYCWHASFFSASGTHFGCASFPFYFLFSDHTFLCILLFWQNKIHNCITELRALPHMTKNKHFQSLC